MTGRRLQWKQHVALAVALAMATPAVVASPVLGAEDGTVHATVTVGAPCLTLETTSVDFGTISFNTPETNNFRQTDTLYVTNCSGTDANFLVRGTDAISATSAATWSLYQGNFGACTLGPNAYRLTHWDLGGSIWWAFHLTTSDQIAKVGVPAAGQHPYRLDLLMPCSGSDGAGETMSFQAIFTATF
jgi:hypothetical protein